MMKTIPISTDTKTCTKCGKTKDVSLFYLTPYGKPKAECKECSKARSRAAAVANPEKTAANQKRFHEAHPEKAGEYARTFNAKPEKKVARRIRQNKWRKQNPDKRAAAEARDRAAHPEKHSAKKARYYKKYRDVLRAKVDRRAKDFPEKIAATHARYYKAHPEKWAGRTPWRVKFPERHAAKQAKRRAHKVNATPAWANEFFISEAYALAKLRTKLTGIKWEVDHIVPLKSKLVCGLHVENNLRVIPAAINRSKGNRYWPDMPTSAHDLKHNF